MPGWLNGLLYRNVALRWLARVTWIGAVVQTGYWSYKLGNKIYDWLMDSGSKPVYRGGNSRPSTTAGSERTPSDAQSGGDDDTDAQDDSDNTDDSTNEPSYNDGGAGSPCY